MTTIRSTPRLTSRHSESAGFHQLFIVVHEVFQRDPEAFFAGDYVNWMNELDSFHRGMNRDSFLASILQRIAGSGVFTKKEFIARRDAVLHAHSIHGERDFPISAKTRYRRAWFPRKTSTVERSPLVSSLMNAVNPSPVFHGDYYPIGELDTIITCLHEIETAWIQQLQSEEEIAYDVMNPVAVLEDPRFQDNWLPLNTPHRIIPVHSVLSALVDTGYLSGVEAMLAASRRGFENTLVAVNATARQDQSVEVISHAVRVGLWASFETDNSKIDSEDMAVVFADHDAVRTPLPLLAAMVTDPEGYSVYDPVWEYRNEGELRFEHEMSHISHYRFWDFWVTPLRGNDLEIFAGHSVLH
jgi:hypothetical protein